MPRDAVSRTANVERTARHQWVNDWLGITGPEVNVLQWMYALNKLFYRTVLKQIGSYLSSKVIDKLLCSI